MQSAPQPPEERCTVPIAELDAPIGVISVVVWSVRGRAGTRGSVAVGGREKGVTS